MLTYKAASVSEIAIACKDILIAGELLFGAMSWLALEIC